MARNKEGMPPPDKVRTVLYLITKATVGGAQRYVFDIVTHLPAGYEPVVAFGVRGKLAQDLAHAGIETRELPRLGRDIALLDDIGSFFAIWKCLRTERPDVVHLNSSKAAALGALAARLSGVPRIVFTVHGWPFKEARNPLWRAFTYLASWLTSVMSHATIVVSRADEARGKRMWLAGKKMHYVPLGIEPPAFLPRKEAAASLAITTTRPRIVTIAELTPNKGLRYAVEAVGTLADRRVDAEYFIIGEGEERQRLEGLADERGVKDRVHFLGFVQDAAKYLPAFDVFLLPSLKEGVPYVLLEAAAAGLPIVTTTAVDMEIASARKLPPADPHALSDALAHAVGRTPIHAAGTSKDSFPLDAMLGETIALYQSADSCRVA
ncbi:MAG: glycosyltransferase [Patescibacteria group bacterium]|nr:glycosyltransferase [Patescibacteria group bacterium]